MSSLCQNQDHVHDKDHEETRQQSEKNLRFTVVAQIIFVGFQIAGAVITGSQALFSDALHALTDGVAVVIAWLGEILSHTRKPHQRKSRAYFSNLAALIVAALILLASITVIVNCVHILYTGEGLVGEHIHAHQETHEIHVETERPLDTIGMMIFAAIGLVYSLFFSHRLNHGHTHNEKILSLHMLMDAGNWLLTILGAIIIHYTNFIRLDAILGLVYTVLVLVIMAKRLRATLLDFYNQNGEVT